MMPGPLRARARLEVIVLEAHADAISVATLLSLTIAADRDKPKRTWSACRSKYQLGNQSRSRARTSLASPWASRTLRAR
jgi:hypothetical protein